jgi:hypothetical protein
MASVRIVIETNAGDTIDFERDAATDDNIDNILIALLPKGPKASRHQRIAIAVAGSMVYSERR